MLYRALVEHQCAEIPSEWAVSVCFTPANAEEEMRNWLEPHFASRARFLPQVDGDLGQRLIAIVRTEFAGGCERIFLIGGDCPSLSHDYFRQADAALDSNDVVIGPAQDGGYVLLGLKQPLDTLGITGLDRCDSSRPRGFDSLFTNITWSSSAVLDQTLLAAHNHNLSVRLLHPLADIDDAASLNDQSELIRSFNEKCQGRGVKRDSSRR